MIRISLWMLFFLFTVVRVFSQQDPLFTQYIYNKLAFNPAYAGSGGVLAMDLITRFQWTGIPGAPRTITFSAHTPLRNPHIGLGLYVYRDELGPTADYGAMAAFAYRVLFPSVSLCFGIQAGFKYMDIDWGSLNPKDPGDLELTGQVRNRMVPDADFGMYLYGKRFYAGISVKHLLQNQIVATSDAPGDATGFTRLWRTWYVMAGGGIPLAEELVFLPSILGKYVPNAPFQADLHASLLFKSLLTLGISFRTQSALGFLVEVVVIKGLTIGYSYDIWFNSLKSYNSGSHEIRIGYELGLFDKERMLTPRYF
jgi:type IX secretion system PorP/SprF family membrane protein